MKDKEDLPFKSVLPFKAKDIIKRLKVENQFIVNLCRTLPGLHLSEPVPKETAVNSKPDRKFDPEIRASSLQDLQTKLQDWKGKHLGEEDRRLKRYAKNKINKQKKKEARKAMKGVKKVTFVKKKQPPLPQSDVEPPSAPIVADIEPSSDHVEQPSAPIVADIQPSSDPLRNEDNPVVYNKFDHYESLADVKQHKKKSQDPKKILKMLQRKEEIIQKLTNSGDVEKANKIKNDSAWKSALNRAQGSKVKDDPKLLMKTIKNKNRQKKKSQREWAERNKQVESKMKQKQEKREANIKEKQRQKKATKMKRLVKRGRLIPGYSKFE